MKRIFLVIISLSFILFNFTGCGRVDLPEKIENTTIYITDDNKIDYYITDTFEKDYYSLDELKSMAEGEVSDYLSQNNLSNDSIAIKNANLVVNNGTNVLINYEFKDYVIASAFLGENIYIGTVADAVQNNYSFEDTMIDVKTGETVSKDQVLKKNNRQVFISDIKSYIYCPKDILYISSNCKYCDGYVDALESEGTVTIVTK